MADPSPTSGGRRGAGELVKRIGSALVAAPVALAAVWFGSPWFELLLALVLAIGAHEWCRLCSLGWRAGGAAVWFAPLATLLVATFAEPAMSAAMLLLGVGIAALQQAGGIASPPQPAGRWAAGGAALLGVTAWSAMYLRVWVPDSAPIIHPWIPHGASNIFWLFAVVWAADIGAYFTGRAFGGPKLAPRISPGKTWSGFVGGMILATIIGGAGGWLKAGEPILAAFIVALAVAVASAGGDLLESWVKRRFGAKDSGTLMPGHGGVLDRIDGILTAAPVLAIIAAIASGDPVTWQ